MNTEATAPKTRTWPLVDARRMAEHIQRELAGLCERIDIAGSIRRQRPEVHDIDLVLLLKPGMRESLDRRIRSSANTRVLKDGPQNIILLLHNGLQVDLYLATPTEDTLLGPIPTNYGMRLLAMTGSREHNVKLAKIAKEKGVHFHPYKGLMRGGQYRMIVPEVPEGEWAKAREEYEGGEVFCGEHEAAIFEALGVPYVNPEDREA